MTVDHSACHLFYKWRKWSKWLVQSHRAGMWQNLNSIISYNQFLYYFISSFRISSSLFVPPQSFMPPLLVFIWTQEVSGMSCTVLRLTSLSFWIHLIYTTDFLVRPHWWKPNRIQEHAVKSENVKHVNSCWRYRGTTEISQQLWMNNQYLLYLCLLTEANVSISK